MTRTHFTFSNGELSVQALVYWLPTLGFHDPNPPIPLGEFGIVPHLIMAPILSPDVRP